MDLFIQDGNDISSGNMRRREQSSMNEAVANHNSQIAKNINDIQDNLKQTQSSLNEGEALKQIAGAAGDLMGAHALHSGLKNYQQWTANRAASKTENLRSQLREVAGNVKPPDTEVAPQTTAQPQVVAQPENTTNSPPETAAPEGTPAQGSSDPAPTATDHEAATVGEDGAGKSGSMIHDGLKAATGLSDEAIEKVGKGAGVLGAAATGGLDIYDDIKEGKIAGDNGWEKAGNVVNIGGAISDIAGAAFPPAELLGGFLDLIGGGLDAIGEAVEGSEKKSEAKEQAQQATEQQQKSVQGIVVAPQEAPVATARAQG
jgi:hypothetical protein